MNIDRIRKEIKDRIEHLENKLSELDTIEGLKNHQKKHRRKRYEEEICSLEDMLRY